MISPPVETIFSAVVTGLAGLFTYLIKNYFKRFHSSQKAIHTQLTKLEAKLDILGDEIRKNTIENAKLQTEVKAVWRFIDRSYQRASDNGGRYE